MRMLFYTCRKRFQRAGTDGSETPFVYMQFLDGPDRRHYNAPFVNEVAIFASSDGAPPKEFVLHTGIMDYKTFTSEAPISITFLIYESFRTLCNSSTE